MKKWKVAVMLTAMGSLMLLGGCKKNAPLDDEQNLNASQIYYDFIENELADALGIANISEQTVTIHSENDNWFDCTGILSAYMNDLDQDGVEDLLLLRMVEVGNQAGYENADSVYQMVASVYSIEEDAPVLQSETMIQRTEGDIIYFPSTYTMDEDIYVSAVEQDGVTYIVFEEQCVANAFADGYTKNFWALTYADSRLDYAYQFVQDGVGSAGMTYTANTYEDGELKTSEIFFDMEEADSYEAYDEAVKDFFELQGLTVIYSNFEKSIFAGTGLQDEIMEFHIQVGEIDFENQNYPFNFRVEDKTNLRDNISYEMPEIDATTEADASTKEDTETTTEATTESNTQAETEKPADNSVWNAYATIVESYAYAYDLVQQSGPEGLNLEIVNEQYLIDSTNADLTPGFHVQDINGDGTPELFVGLRDRRGADPVIYDLYTYQNGQAYQLMANLGYRSGTCILCNEGYIKDSYSSSAFEGGVRFWYLEPNATELSLEEGFTIMADSENPDEVHYIYRSGFAASTYDFTEEEYEQTLAYYTPVLYDLTDSTDANIQSLRTGRFTPQ